MSKTAVLEPRFVEMIASEVSCRPQQVQAASELFAEGATVPFVARYRKEATGGLEDVQLETLSSAGSTSWSSPTAATPSSRASASRGSSPPSWRPPIRAAVTKQELEDLYLPYKPKRRTRAQIAREKGLEPLADALLAGAAGARRCRRSWRPRSSTPRRGSRTRRPPWPARATSSPSAWPRTPPSAPSCAGCSPARGGAARARPPRQGEGPRGRHLPRLLRPRRAGARHPLPSPARHPARRARGFPDLRPAGRRRARGRAPRPLLAPAARHRLRPRRSPRPRRTATSACSRPSIDQRGALRDARARRGEAIAVFRANLEALLLQAPLGPDRRSWGSTPASAPAASWRWSTAPAACWRPTSSIPRSPSRRGRRGADRRRR